MLNKDIMNIILNYIKPLKYLNELNNSIKMIKYDGIKYNYESYMFESVVKNIFNKWVRDYEFYILDYRLQYQQNKIKDYIKTLIDKKLIQV